MAQTREVRVSGIGSWLVGAVLSALALAGLMMAAHGHSPSFYWMGLALFAFGYGMIMLLIKASYDQDE
jgi:hypothetical protein